MANYGKKKNQEKVVESLDTEPIVKDVSDEPTTLKRKFSNEDLISCVSITPGELFVIGEKSKNLYTFADTDYPVEIEYRDLKYAAASKDKIMFKPRYIVQDKDFLAEYPELEKLYGDLYSGSDLQKILKMSPKEMEKAIKSLPLGAQEALKSIASTQIENKQLDSVQRVKVLDKIFGTELVMKLVE